MVRRIYRAIGFCACIAIAFAACVESPQQQLLSAVVSGDISKVQTLLDNPSVDVNWQAPFSRESALLSAASYSRVEIVRLLLRRGANPNIATDDFQTPLQLAAYFGSQEICEMLIASAADLNTAETANGHTALVAAARNGHIQIIRLLLHAGADRAIRIKDGRMAYQVAQQYGHIDAANLLLTYKPQSSAQTPQ